MKISLLLVESIYNCEVIIKTPTETQKHFLGLEKENEIDINVLNIEVTSSEFEMTVIPHMAEYKSAFAEMETSGWKERIAKKVGNAIFEIMDNGFLRVGCTYKLYDVEENDTIEIRFQQYFFGTFDRFDLLGLIPMAYMFFEVFQNGALCKCIDAFGQNRKSVISCARTGALSHFGFLLIFTYPIQVGRIKRLSKNKKVKKTIIKFNRLSDKKRQKILDRIEKKADRL